MFLILMTQKENKKIMFYNDRFELRFSLEEKMKLEQLATKNSKSKAEIIRELVNNSFEKINLANKTSLAN